MTKQELREIDRRVALALGAKAYTVACVEGHPLYRKYYVTFGRSGLTHREIDSSELGFYLPMTEDAIRQYGFYDVPPYTTDPAVADWVRQEIERRGWFWQVRGTMLRPAVYIAEVGPAPFWGRESYNSPHVALCLAFLAAHEAQAQEGSK